MTYNMLFDISCYVALCSYLLMPLLQLYNSGLPCAVMVVVVLLLFRCCEWVRQQAAEYSPAHRPVLSNQQGMQAMELPALHCIVSLTVSTQHLSLMIGFSDKDAPGFKGRKWQSNISYWWTWTGNTNTEATARREEEAERVAGWQLGEWRHFWG